MPVRYAVLGLLDVYALETRKLTRRKTDLEHLDMADASMTELVMDAALSRAQKQKGRP